jgi:hypothetical protein
MDIDFHFSTVYVLARWAGFGSDNARLLATCSQLVDDNIDDKMPHFSAFPQRFSGHEIWENVREVENAEVWVPFHFLPALDGDTLDQQLVCRKNSVLAQALAADMRTYSGKDRLFRLGIALHVYADTWAHQEFSGITSAGNTLLGLESQPEQKISLEWLEYKAAPFANLKPLGHAAAVHFPDQPYLYWHSEQKFPEGRSNWVEFLEAARALYQILCVVGESPVQELSARQALFLSESFQEIQDEDCNDRNETWLQRIQMNYFEFAELTELDQCLEYQPGLIMADADYPKLFYQGIEEHYAWVKSQLETAGLEDVI